MHSFRFSSQDRNARPQSGSYLKDDRSSKSTSNLHSFYPPKEDRYQYSTGIGHAAHIGEESNRSSLYRNYLLDRRNSKQQIISGSSFNIQTSSTFPPPPPPDLREIQPPNSNTNYSFDPPARPYSSGRPATSLHGKQSAERNESQRESPHELQRKRRYVFFGGCFSFEYFWWLSFLVRIFFWSTLFFGLARERKFLAPGPKNRRSLDPGVCVYIYV